MHKLAALFIVLLPIVGCGSDSTTTTVDAAPVVTPDSAPLAAPDSAPLSAPDATVAIVPDAAPVTIDAPPAPDAATAGTVTLTVEDYLRWCSVTVEGGAATTVASTTMTFPMGTVVDLTAMKASATFVFGYWAGTDGDTTSAHDTNMDTTVTMTGNKTVQACCPFASAPTVPCGAP